MIFAGRLKDHDRQSLFDPKHRKGLLQDANLIPTDLEKKLPFDFPAFHRHLHIIIYLSRHALQQAIYSQPSPNISTNSWGARRSNCLQRLRAALTVRVTEVRQRKARVHCGKMGWLCWFDVSLLSFLPLPPPFPFMWSCWLLLQPLTVRPSPLRCTITVWYTNSNRKCGLLPIFVIRKKNSLQPLNKHRSTQDEHLHVSLLFCFFFFSF